MPKEFAVDYKADRLDNLDGLRGFAALFVVVGHVCGVLGFRIFDNGGAQVGVQLFFCLSGFLMGMLYLDKPISLTAVLSFYRRRAARVLPMYLAVVFASFVLLDLTGSPILYAIDTSNLAEHLLFTDAVSVLWTVPVEVHFYLMFGLIWLMFSTNKPVSIALIALAIPALVIISDPLGLRFYMGSFFLVGAVISLLPRIATNAGFVAGLALLFVALPEVAKSLGLDFVQIWKSPLNLIAVGVLVSTSVAAPVARTVLGNSVARYLGKISYSVYLIHWPIMAALIPLVGYKEHPTMYAASVLACTIAVATATYYLIEKPMRQLVMAPMRPDTSRILVSGESRH